MKTLISAVLLCLLPVSAQQIGANQIRNGAITTPKLADGSVTNAKLAPGAGGGGGGSGSVTSVNVGTAVSGISFTGGPITTSGTITFGITDSSLFRAAIGAPSTTGTGASGFWPISVTGSSVSAGNLYNLSTGNTIADLGSGWEVSDNTLVSGTVTATGFIGPGSGITGVAKLGANTFSGNQTTTGTVTATTFAGSGASLANLPAASLTGSVADARLSANVSLLNGTTAFTAGQSINPTSPNIVLRVGQVDPDAAVAAKNADVNGQLVVGRNTGTPGTAVMSIGQNGGTGGWIQVRNEKGSNNAVYPLSLQPVGGSVGVGTTSPDAKAALDVVSTTQGVLFPRMTTTQKNAISSPPAGLMVYDTTLGKLCIRTASAWETVTSS